MGSRNSGRAARDLAIGQGIVNAAPCGLRRGQLVAEYEQRVRTLREEERPPAARSAQQHFTAEFRQRPEMAARALEPGGGSEVTKAAAAAWALTTAEERVKYEAAAAGAHN